MSNFLHNLLARSLGRADVVQPLIAPRFAASTVDVAGDSTVSDVLPRQELQPKHDKTRADFVHRPLEPQPASRASIVPQQVAQAQQTNMASLQPLAAPQTTAQTYDQRPYAVPENVPSSH